MAAQKIAPSVEALTAKLDGALASLSCWGASLPMAWDWGWVGFDVLSSPCCSMILFFCDHSVTVFQIIFPLVSACYLVSYFQPKTL